jgi:hypothetical protein
MLAEMFVKAANVTIHKETQEKLLTEITTQNQLILFNSINFFKENLLVSRELIDSKSDWCALIEAIQNLKTKKYGLVILILLYF